MGKDKVYFPNLDGLRTLAFLAVFLAHGFREPFSRVEVHNPALQLVKDNLFNSGDVGVAFFFVLSGFLITYLILKEIDVTGRVDVKAFYARRFLRVWPLYYATVGVGFFLINVVLPRAGWPAGQPGPVRYYLLFFSNSPDLRCLDIPLLVGITWSVSIEEQFYLVWPQLFAHTPRVFFQWVIAGVIVGSAAFRYLHRDDAYVCTYHSLSVISDLAVGGLAAYLSLYCRRFISVFEGLRPRTILAVYGLGILLVLLRNQIYINSPMLVVSTLVGLLVLFRRVILSLFFAFVILEQNWSRSSIIKMSSLKTLTRLGKYTYGLYLLHPLGLLASAWLLAGGAASVAAGVRSFRAGMVQGLLGLALSLLLSFASYHGFEKPFLRLKKRLAHVQSGGSG